MKLEKPFIEAALSLSGFENWQPPVDVPELHRPRHRPTELPGEGRTAAVMLLLYQHSSSRGRRGINLVLTRRHERLAKHAGQISLPGGRQDEGESLRTTAVRETSEEIGVNVEDIEILGELNPVYIPPSDFTVSPFVGWHAGQPNFVRSEREVDEIIEVSLKHLLTPETMVEGEVEIPDGKKLRVPYYQVEHHQVWGATALILGEFIERLTRVSSEAK
jgi:8-oxo-dGTP pyrophosphatase MutT (NUDIX family)